MQKLLPSAIAALLAGAGIWIAVGAASGRAVDAGMLPVQFAAPAEVVSVHELSRGQTFGELLEGARMSLEEQRAVLLAFSEHASARRMRDGTEIVLKRRKDDGLLRGVDVELSPDESVRITRSEAGWRSHLVETPVWVDTVFAAGTITDMLWTAVDGNAALNSMPTSDRAQLIHRLDQVFQWQVDFSRQIQRGDFYRFAFERVVRPDGSMRSAVLLAAELVNSGTPIQAIYFDPSGDGEGSYFDGEGLSVRRAFLTKPLEFRRISSRFSSGRFHPILQRWRAHRGIDYAADRGTPIMATADGTVVRRGRLGQLGNAVELRHANGFITRYGHMSRFASELNVGNRVTQGQVIGYVGMTGLATGPHLHYEMHRGGRALDPLSVDLPAGDPVPEEAWDLWQTARASHLALIEQLPSQAPPTIADLTNEEAERLNERVRAESGS